MVLSSIISFNAKRGQWATRPALLVTLWFWGVSAASVGCGESPDRGTFVAAGSSPSLGKADGTDVADQSCQVVLRQVGRQPGGDDYETACADGACPYVWRGTVEVAEEVDPAATVHVLYHLADDPTWWQVAAVVQSGANPGFRRYKFAISEHLFGPAPAVGEGDDAPVGDAPVDDAPVDDAPVGDAPVIELVAFVRLPDGTRLFDHNRYAGPLENYRLTEEQSFSAWDGTSCQPVVGTLFFHGNWDEGSSGARRQGGYLRINYDIDRLPQCRGTHNGHPAWDVVAHARFLPGGQVLSGSVRQLANNNGIPVNQAQDKPLVLSIPADATRVELWFENYTGAGSSCQAWDSNENANYVYDIWPAADHPRCLGVEKETGVQAEDHRMVHHQPYCLGYDLDGQYDANHCELLVEGFGDGKMGHYGIPYHWLVAYVQVGLVDGQVLNAGQYTRYRDLATGAQEQRFSLGMEVAPGLYKTGFAYLISGMMGAPGSNFSPEAFAFFVDVQRPSGQVVRLWQSQQGANYSWDDAFGLPTNQEYIPYGNIQWANPQAPVLGSKAECQ